MTQSVEITLTGRGGGITYHEDDHRIEFDWEFAMSPAIALVWGPKSSDWDAIYPWAAGRQTAIYDFVGAEIVRQKASNGAFEYDLELGHLTILNETGARAKGLYVNRGAASAEQERLRVSVDARLEVAESTGDPATIETALGRDIRKLFQARDGLDRAMRLAIAYPSESVQQALLWASYNGTECAPRCAETLMSIRETTPDLSILSRLGKYVSDIDRSAAFTELCERLGMQIDHGFSD